MPQRIFHQISVEHIKAAFFHELIRHEFSQSPTIFINILAYNDLPFGNCIKNILIFFYPPTRWQAQT